MTSSISSSYAARRGRRWSSDEESDGELSSHREVGSPRQRLYSSDVGRGCNRFASLEYSDEIKEKAISPRTSLHTRGSASVHPFQAPLGHHHHHYPLARDKATRHYATFSLVKEDQQEAIALVYWRRKMLESFFDAWKWIVKWQTRSRQTYHQYHHYATKKTFSSTRPQARGLRRYEDDDNDLHNMHQDQDMSKANGCRVPTQKMSSFKWNDENSHEPANRQEFVRHLRRKYEPTPVNASGTNPLIKRMQDQEDDGDTSKPNHEQQRKRRFRDNIRVIYQSFCRWKEWISESCNQRAQRLDQAKTKACRRLLQKHFDAWRRHTQARHQHTQDILDAWYFHDRRRLHKGLCMWKHQWLVANEIGRLQKHRQRRRMRNILITWFLIAQRWTQLASSFRAVQKKHQLHVLRTRWKVLMLYTIDRQMKAKLRAKCQPFFVHHARLQAMVQWKRNVFQSRLYLASIHGKTRLGLASAIRHWRKLIFLKREQRQFQEKCSCFAHFRIQRTAWRQWQILRKWHQRQKSRLQQADAWHQRTRKKRFIQALGQFTRRRLQSYQRLLDATRWCSRRRLQHTLRRWKQATSCTSRYLQVVAATHKSFLKQQFLLWHRAYERRVQWRLQYTSLVLRQHRHALSIAVRDWRQTIKLTRLTRRWCRVHQQTWRTRCFYAWQEVTKQRRARRQILQIVVKQHVTHDSRRAFRQWKGAILRKKCLNKLVHLFLKKQRRARKQQTFWRLKFAVQVAKFQRKHFEQRFVRDLLVSWHQIARRHRESREQKLMAHAFDSSQKLCTGLFRWIRFHRAQRGYRQQRSKADELWSSRNALRVFTMWHRWTQKEIAVATGFATCLQSHQEQLRLRASCHWKEWTRRRVIKRQQKQLAAVFWRETELFRSWLRWLRFLDHQDKKNIRDSLVKKLVVTHKWRRWRRCVVDNQRLRAKMCDVRETMQQFQVHQAVCLWKFFAQARNRHRKNLMTASHFRRQELVGGSVARWLARTKTHKRCTKKQNAVLQRQFQQKLRNAVAFWHTFAQQTRVRRTQIYQFKLDQSYQRMHHLWSAWHRFILKRREKHQVFRAAVDHAQRQLRCRVLRKWRRFTGLKAKLHLLFGRENRWLYRVTFVAWRKFVTRRVEIRKGVKRWQFNRCVKPCWQQWRAFHDLLATSRGAKHKLIQLHQRNGKRKCLENWKALVGARNHESWACERVQALQLNATLVRWRKRTQASMQQRKRVQQMAFWYVRRSLTVAIRRWIDVQRLVIASRSQRQRADDFYRFHLKHRMLLNWNHQAHVQMQECERTASQFRSRHLLLCSWKQLHRWVRRQCRIYELESQRNGRLVAKIWHQWAHRFVSLARHRQIQFQQAQTSCELHRLQLSWSLWRRFLAIKSQQAANRAIASAFYTCEWLQRRIFEAWWQFTLFRRQCNADKVKASGWHQNQMLHGAFGIWLDWLSHQQVKRDIARRQHCQLVAVRLAKALDHWRQNTRGKRSVAKMMFQAIQFHQMRRESISIRRWTQLMQRKQQVKSQHANATHCWAHHLVQRLWNQWKCFWNWRRSHRQLVLLFNSNCQSVCFAKWKRFHDHQHRKRLRLAQAREWNHLQSQKRHFHEWRTFLVQQTQTRQAKKFCASHLQRRVLNLWCKQTRFLHDMTMWRTSRRNKLLKKLLDRWKAFVLMTKTAQAREAKVQQSWRHKQVQSLRTWKQFLHRVQQESQRRIFAHQFRIFHLRYKCFCSWRNVVLMARQQLVHAKQMAALKSLRRNWIIWLDWMLVQSTRRQKLQAKQKQMQQFRLLRTTRRLRHHCQQQQKLTRVKSMFAKHHLATAWYHWTLWQRHRVSRKQVIAQAVAHAQTRLVAHAFRALKHLVHRLKNFREILCHSRCRLVFSIAARCFFQWNQFARCKHRLVALVKRHQTSLKRNHLLAWHGFHSRRAMVRSKCQCFEIERHHKLLHRTFVHWESVATDKWINQILAQSFGSIRAVKQLRRWFDMWRGHGKTHHLRKVWRSKARKINGKSLRRRVCAWHQAAETTKRHRLAVEKIQRTRNQRLLHHGLVKWKNHSLHWWRGH